MPTLRLFQDMLNQYLPLDLLKTEMAKRMYVLENVKKDEGWFSGPLQVPFEGAQASSISFGSLTASNDISDDVFVRGAIATQPEAWGTMRFLHKDLMQHSSGKIPEDTFLKILPGRVEAFANFFKTAVSTHLCSRRGVVANLTANGTAGGVAAVDRIDRFTLGQKLVLDDNDSSPVDVYVIAINVNTRQLTVSATRGGAALDISAYTTAQQAALYYPGVQAEGMTSIQSQLLSLANGGSAALFGQTKLSFPYLQAVNVSGAGMTAANIMQVIFDAWSEYLTIGRMGTKVEVVMSYRLFGHVLKAIEAQKGAFNIQPNSRVVSQYGYQKVSIGSVEGTLLTLVGIQEWSETEIGFLDWDSFTFYSNGFLQRRKAPDGKEYFEERATSGYAYILDHCIMGDLVCTAPWKNAIIHSIPATLPAS